jgi:hypothetical protein
MYVMMGWERNKNRERETEEERRKEKKRKEASSRLCLLALPLRFHTGHSPLTLKNLQFSNSSSQSHYPLFGFRENPRKPNQNFSDFFTFSDQNQNLLGMLSYFFYLCLAGLICLVKGITDLIMTITTIMTMTMM